MDITDRYCMVHYVLNVYTTHQQLAAYYYHIKNTIWVGEEPAQLAFPVVEDHRIHHPVFIDSFADVKRDQYHYLKV